MKGSEPPEAIRAKNRRKKLKKTWETDDWKTAKEEFVRGRVCDWCGSEESLVPHHPRIEAYRDLKSYLDFQMAGCLVLCQRCHWAVHHARKICPLCRRAYLPNQYDCCWDCLPADTREQIELAKAKRLHQKREHMNRENERRREWYRKIKQECAQTAEQTK